MKEKSIIRLSIIIILSLSIKEDNSIFLKRI
jgi:hypothetical protein